MADPPQSASPDDLALAQLIPLLCDDIWAKANCQLRLRDGSRLVVPVETLAWAQARGVLFVVQRRSLLSCRPASLNTACLASPSPQFTSAGAAAAWNRY